MLNQSSRALSLLFAISLVAVACGDDDDTSDAANGGSGAKGGAGGTSGGRGGAGGVTGGSGGRGGGTTGGGSNGGATTGGTATGGAATGGATLGGAGGETGGAPTGGTDPGTGGADIVAGAGGFGGSPEGGSSGNGTGGGDPQGGWSGGGTAGVGGTGDGGSDEGGAGAGGAPVVAITLANPGFDTGTGDAAPVGWTQVGDGVASYTHYQGENARSPYGYLNLWDDAPYTVTTSQVVSSLQPGNYRATVWHLGGPYTAQYFFVKGHDISNVATQLTANTTDTQSAYELLTINFVVTSTSVEIGFYSQGASGNWSRFDDVALTYLP